MAEASQQGPTTGAAPYLTVKGAKAAIAFYSQAFGAEEIMVMLAKDGERVMHAHLKINGGAVMLSDEFPEYLGGPYPPPAGVMIHLQVDDADKWAKRAADAGATVTMPVGDQFWGDRYGQLKDPFGHTWAIGSAIKK
jgi:PhnB protein